MRETKTQIDQSLAAMLSAAFVRVSRKTVMRKFGILAGLVFAYALLAGCDKCSHEIQDIRLPLPHACSR